MQLFKMLFTAVDDSEGKQTRDKDKDKVFSAHAVLAMVSLAGITEALSRIYTVFNSGTQGFVCMVYSSWLLNNIICRPSKHVHGLGKKKLYDHP